MQELESEIEGIEETRAARAIRVRQLPALLCLGWMTLAGAAAAQETVTYLRVESRSSDAFVQTPQVLVTSEDGAFFTRAPMYPDEVVIAFEGDDGSQIDLHFLSHDLELPRPATYADPECDGEGALEPTLDSDPSYALDPDYTNQCEAGEVRVLEAEYGAAGELLRFAADFAYRGAGWMGDVVGSVRFRASSDFELALCDAGDALCEEDRESPLDERLPLTTDSDEAEALGSLGLWFSEFAFDPQGGPWRPPFDLDEALSPEEARAVVEEQTAPPERHTDAAASEPESPEAAAEPARAPRGEAPAPSRPERPTERPQRSGARKQTAPTPPLAPKAHGNEPGGGTGTAGAFAAPTHPSRTTEPPEPPAGAGRSSPEEPEYEDPTAEEDQRALPLAPSSEVPEAEVPREEHARDRTLEPPSVVEAFPVVEPSAIGEAPPAVEPPSLWASLRELLKRIAEWIDAWLTDFATRRLAAPTPGRDARR